ncbi:integrase [Mesorhizobium amorphae CCBAU 01583]|nr:integrase [Mesorhizobium amorphae CCBAU 01583]
MAEMSPLRRRMIEDMTIRNLSPATPRSYIHAVAKFSRYFGRSPERLALEDVRAFQVHLVQSTLAAALWGLGPVGQSHDAHSSSAASPFAA